MPPKFKVVGLCRNRATREGLLSELAKADFPSESIFLLRENSSGQTDCYGLLRSALEVADSEYVVWLHDDIAFDSLRATDLANALDFVVNKEPSAAVFGVAGKRTNWYEGFGRFRHAEKEWFWGFTQQPMYSLDECFLVVRAGCGITPSDGLTGYHFYGTDLCLQAERVGKSAHIIDFPVTHHSQGSLDQSFFRAKRVFEQHLQRTGVNRFLPTTCTLLYGGKNFFAKAIRNHVSLSVARLSQHKDTAIAERELSHDAAGEYGKWADAAARLFVAAHLFVRTGGFGRLNHRLRGDVRWWSKNWKTRVFPGNAESFPPT